MYSDCLLFSGRRGLDNTEMRQSILRIPEVSRRLKEAQLIIDSLLPEADYIDLFSKIQGSDEDFSANTNLKSLISACVQIGLFDRYVKYRSRPQFLVGRINGCSALLVCAQQQNMSDFITQSDFFRQVSLIKRLNTNQNQLAGLKLEEYGVLQWNGQGQYLDYETESKDVTSILDQLSQENLIGQCIHVGPCFEFLVEEFQKNGLQNIPSMSSIDIDPILNSFWKSA